MGDPGEFYLGVPVPATEIIRAVNGAHAFGSALAFLVPPAGFPRAGSGGALGYVARATSMALAWRP